MNGEVDPSRKTNARGIHEAESSWIVANTGIVKYFFFLSLAAALVSFVCFGYLFNTSVYLEYLEAVTRGASQVLLAMGEPNIIIKNDLSGIDGRILGGWDTDIVVERAAGGVLITLLLAAAMVFWPASWQKKIIGIVLGAGLVISTNVLRIAGSLLADLYYPLQFELLSTTVLPLLHTSIAILFFLIWAWWSGGHPSN